MATIKGTSLEQERQTMYKTVNKDGKQSIKLSSFDWIWYHALYNDVKVIPFTK